ncbi:MAG TPA: carbohydrate ABC transporter permease [Caldilinea sp.]|nr:carbohydrate ABC transporter permease [Caldilinea sp.]
MATTTADLKPSASQQAAKRSIGKRSAQGTLELLIWILLLIVAVGMLMPILWMFATSLRPPAQSFSLPPSFFPTQWRWENYWNVITSERIGYPRLFWNSIYLAVTVTVLQLATCSLAAFAFARLRFPGRDLLFFTLLASMMIPGVVTMVPLFMIVSRLNLTDNHLSIILPAATSAFGIFLLRQFFLTLPSELSDAAKIDGAGYFTLYWRIMLPLVGPGLSTLGVFAFLGNWNSFLFPLLFLTSRDKMTLPLALVSLAGYMGSGSQSEILAAIFMSILPLALIFVFAQRFILQGIALSGIKG